MNWGRNIKLGAAAMGALLATACAGDESDADDGGAGCVGAKCDDPGEDGTGTDTDGETDGDTDGFADLDPEEVDRQCKARREEAFNPNRMSFNLEFLRWSCADVDGTLPTERGQEYCEYFAIAQVPDGDGELGDPQVLGVNLGVDHEQGQTPFGLDLDKAEIAALEAEPERIVGQCVFTSWNADIENPNGPCRGECYPDTYIQGVPLNEDVFRMKIDPNTFDAAAVLIEDCTEFYAPAGDLEDPDDPFHDAFYRACWLNAEINETQHRKSDNVICAASVRLAECGCGLTNGAYMPDALAREGTLGFPLGTWEARDELPSGCKYEPVGKGGEQSLVTCDLTALEVAQNATELKAYCQERFADDVVVYIPVPAGAIECEPQEGEQYSDNCSGTPWVLTP